MTKARKDGLLLVFLGASVIFLLLAFMVHARSSGSFEDFIADYYSARCLIHNCDPYNESQVLQSYRAEGGERPLSLDVDRQIATRYVYPPTTLTIMLPFALLPWGPAHFLWLILSTGSYVLAAVLAWDLGARDAPILCGAFVAFLLANSEVIVVLCNPSEIVIAFGIIAVWCFLRDRAIPVGVFCLAVSLLIKPQIMGLLWLYFLLAGSKYRKWALQTFGVAAVIAIPVILWVSIVAPHWLHELRANVAAFSVPGGLNDPGPASKTARDLVDLQVVFSRFRDIPAFYNPVSYAVIGPLLAVWAYLTARLNPLPANVVLGIASAVPLSMLPVHHHFYDAKLLLMTLPALALLWIQKGTVARIALGLTASAFLVTGDVTWMLLKLGLALFHPQANSFADWVVDALRVFPAPLILLGTGIFYLWAYWRTAHTAPIAVAPSVVQGRL